MWRQAVLGLLLVLRMCSSWYENKHLPVRNCKYFKSHLAMHCTRPMTNLMPFLEPLDSVFLVTFKFHLFVPIDTLLRQFTITWTDSLEKIRDTFFALLLGGICYYVSSRISWPNLLPRGKFRCLMTLWSVISVLLINFSRNGCTSSTTLLRPISDRHDIVISTWSAILWKWTHLPGWQHFGFMQKNPLYMALPCSSDLTFDHSNLLHFLCK